MTDKTEATTDPSDAQKSTGFLWCLPTSTIGSKVIVALTGTALFIFVIAHLLANLQMFVGPDPVNAYGYMLKSNPPLLWTARTGLIVVFVVHILVTLRLRNVNAEARPIPYAKQTPQASTLASRTMLFSGLAVLFFVAYHLSHFTLMFVDPSYANLKDAQGRHDIYEMAVRGFQYPLIVVLYVLAVSFLGLHLSHALWSICRTLSLAGPASQSNIKKGAIAVAVIITLAYVSIPVAVLTGVIKSTYPQ